MNEAPPKVNGSPSNAQRWNPLRWPMLVRVVVGVFLGAVVGLTFGDRPIALGWSTEHFGTLASLYIRLLTTLATPLIFFAIVDAFVQTDISARQGVRMLFVCGLNIVAAFGIGLTILNVCQPGRAWEGSMQPSGMNGDDAASGTASATDDADTPIPTEPPKWKLNTGDASLSPLEMLDGYVPKSIAQPFAENMVLTVAVLAILVGAAIRSIRRHAQDEMAAAIRVLESVAMASFQVVLTMLRWMIELAPAAIFLAVAGVVGGTGATVFAQAGVFFITVVCALSMHALLYYPLSAWWIGGKSPWRYFREGLAAILTGFSINSSLATAPMTLEALRRLGVSESSARLSACVGTNFNNDGITLYEAITALFVAQAAGMDLTLAQQIAILAAALAGSMGIAGIPGSGLIILTLVLKAAGLPDEVVALALPIVYSVDFINARLRSAVNVMGDMQVAILLDATGKWTFLTRLFGADGETHSINVAEPNAADRDVVDRNVVDRMND